MPGAPTVRLAAAEARGGGRVLVPAGCINLIAACRAEGLTVYDPDVSMIATGGGAVHCMSQALKRNPAAGAAHRVRRTANIEGDFR